jgi:eukaryotic-like serine/threonine-protein kinase
MMIDYTGQQVGSYRLVRRLGSGGFASVYLGQHVRIATQYAAIKILHIIEVDMEQFQREAETTATLQHPNIVRLFDFDFHNEMPFLVVEFAPGGALRARHKKGEQVPLATVVQYVKEIAGALQYAHDKNIIHRDIKPDNILIGPLNELRLSDFGISVLSQTGRTSLHSSFGFAGTPHYMAPEQIKGRPEKASDQYALAVMAYEWLTGKPPFTEGNPINIQYQHTHEPVPPLRDTLPTLAPQVEAVILKALAKNPNDRYPSVRAFADALEVASKALPTSNVPLPSKAAPISNAAPISTSLLIHTGIPGILILCGM